MTNLNPVKKENRFSSHLDTGSQVNFVLKLYLFSLGFDKFSPLSVKLSLKFDLRQSLPLQPNLMILFVPS